MMTFHKNAWFVPYHIYSVSKSYSEKAVKEFEKDLKFAAKNLDVEYIIIEDYYDRLVWGEYSKVWCKSTLNKFIELIHDYGTKILLYTDATELSTTGQQYSKHGLKWGAKSSWGKIYAGYSSILYPSMYFLPQYDWFGKLMCPASGWTKFFMQQVKDLHEEFNLDGIYLDRVDYRVKCYDHLPDPNHFSENLPKFVEKLQRINKSFGTDKILVVNDSCMKPDYITDEIFKITDGILSELLLADMDPYGIENKLAVLFIDMIWPFKRLFRPILTYLLPRFYNTSIMMNKYRMKNIIKRIRDSAGDKDLWLFSHRTDQQSLEFLKQNLDSKNTHICYFTGLKRLHSLK